MQIIPVIDIKNGTVVRARAGNREHYHPIVTPLSRTSDPIDVVRGLLAVHPFGALYIADLDAITGRGDNRAALTRLRGTYPRLVLWVDSGIADADATAAFLAAGTGHLVLGSESQADTTLARQLAHHDRVVLSLDFRGDEFQGPADMLTDTSCWPQKIIAMTLARVGSGVGPDLDRLDEVKRAAAGRAVYAAGGVRDAVDLAALTRLDIAGALVATCLHDGRLTGADIWAALDHGQPKPAA